jgi:Uma2 family endonuclease
MATLPQSMTLEAFLDLPEEEPALEFADGKVTQKVPPQGKHATLQPWLCELINQVLRPRKLGKAYSELRATFAGLSRVPDVAVYRADRIPRDASGEVSDVFRIPPDIAIEIISPGQTTNELVERCVWYVTNGVAAALLVDARHKSVVLFQPDRVPVVLHAADRIELGDLFPGLSLSVGEIFEELLR